MSRLRISAISYLNTAPLMWDFEHGQTGSQFDIAYTLPSGCAQALERGSADIAEYDAERGECQAGAGTEAKRVPPCGGIEH